MDAIAILKAERNKWQAKSTLAYRRGQSGLFYAAIDVYWLIADAINWQARKPPHRGVDNDR